MKLNIPSADKELNDNLPLKNINLNYKFSNNNDISPSIQDCNDDNIDIKIYLVNISFINKRKINSNIDEISKNVDFISDYRTDIITGYSLINAKTLIEKINGYNNYLYIIISPPEKFDLNNKNINIMFSAFDLTDNYFLPLNEYLTMSINQETKLNLGRKLELYTNSIIEIVLNK